MSYLAQKIALVAAFAASVVESQPVSLSGRVLDVNGRGLSNVSVVLTGIHGLATTTQSDGAWSLARTDEVRPIVRSEEIRAFSLRVTDGRIGYLRGDRNPAGRIEGSAHEPVAAIRSAASLSIGVPDTLVYSRFGVVFLKDTITLLQQSGIVRTWDSTWNPRIVYGWLTDERDGQVYRTTTIGSQVWMAQNLNFKSDRAHCYQDSAANCSVYGALYSWSAALGLDDSCDTSSCSAGISSPMRGICPAGWHVPDRFEWIRLIDTTLDSNRVDTVLLSRSGWKQNWGTDSLGFRALPAGFDGGGVFADRGFDLNFWSSTEEAPAYAHMRTILQGMSSLKTDNTLYKGAGFSVRCLLDGGVAE